MANGTGEGHSPARDRWPLPVRVALLTNFVQPYRLPLYRALAARVEALRVFISTPMEANRRWIPDWQGLDVALQKTVTLTRPWKHPHGFSEDVYVHLPYDTVAQLWRYRPDVVISFEVGVRTLLALAYRWLRPSSRLILWAAVSEHSEQGRGQFREWLRRMVIPRVDAVLVNGQSGARYIHRFGVAEERIFFAPYTTNNDPFLAVPLERDREAAHRLLYVGQLVERKGILPFLSVLEAWAEANPERKVEFWLLGDGPLRLRLEDRRWPRNVAIQFLGAVQYDRLPEVYAQAGILVFPTLADEWGVVTNEGMAAGLLVLGSLYSQAVEELVEDGETGWTFHPDRFAEVYAALERTLSLPETRMLQMRSAAREAVRNLGSEAIADGIRDAIAFAAGTLRS